MMMIDVDTANVDDKEDEDENQQNRRSEAGVDLEPCHDRSKAGMTYYVSQKEKMANTNREDIEKDQKAMLQ